jgi:type II restriction enzyme
VSIPTDKSQRKFDFVVYNQKEVILLEVNFYSGGGTKLKATAGEYAGLGAIMKDAGFKFIWITDGLGWHKAHLPLQETFVKNDYVFNLDMIKTGILEEIL